MKKRIFTTEFCSAQSWKAELWSHLEKKDFVNFRTVFWNTNDTYKTGRVRTRDFMVYGLELDQNI